MRNLREKGITLVALVVTIIILLILTGITIGTVTGKNGLFNRSKEIAKEYGDSTQQEENGLTHLGELMNAHKIKPTIKTYIITYNLNGGTGTQSKQTKNQGESIKISETAGTKAKYGFVGWATSQENANAGTVQYKMGDEYSEDKDLTLYAVWKELKVGSAVNYVYDTYVDNDVNPTDGGYTLEGEYSGYGTYTTGLPMNLTSAISQTIRQEIDEWRIMSVNDDGSIDLMGIPKETHQKIYLGGAMGYNNGVYLLDKICNTLYSNKALGIEARSIDSEDIENKMNSTGKNAITNCQMKEDGVNPIPFGKSETTTSYGLYYPKIFAYENGSGVNSTALKANGINKSDDGLDKTIVTGIDIPIKNASGEPGYIKASRITIKETGYELNQVNTYYDNKEFYNLLFNTGTKYWLATRGQVCYGNKYYLMQIVDNSTITRHHLFRGDGNIYKPSENICPIVHLNSNITLSEEENGWNLNKSR